MADEPDGVNEAASTAVRTALTAAAQVAEQLARARQQAAYEAAASSTQETRELSQRLQAERSAARAQLAPVHRAEWWASADAAAIGQAWQTALAWQADPVTAGAAADAADRIRGQVRDRYGIDVDDLGTSPQAVRDALQRQDQERDRAGASRGEAASRDEAEAARLLTQAASQDQDEEVAEAQRIAAINQARPAQQALSTPPLITQRDRTAPATQRPASRRPDAARE